MAEELKEDPKLTEFEKLLCDEYNIDGPILFFSPGEVYDKGILGVSEDHRHIVYGYWKLVDSLAEDFENEWKKDKHEEGEEVPDFAVEAIEWLDTNTICSLPYQDQEVCPIIIYEINNGN